MNNVSLNYLYSSVINILRSVHFLLKFIALFQAYKKVRGETAEYFYLALQSKDLEMDTDEVEAVLLETAWYVMVFDHFSIRTESP